jgi:hypothetical protein
MHMLGNLAGFLIPVDGGLILQKTAGDRKPVIYLMIGIAVIPAQALP